MPNSEIVGIAIDFLNRASDGEIKNALLITEDEDGFRTSNSEMGFSQAIGMAEIAKKMLLECETTEK